MKMKKMLGLLLACVLIAGMIPHSAFAKKTPADGGTSEPYVYTKEDRAVLDREMFSRIDEVVETARKRIGPADELNGGDGKGRAVLTEADYIDLIPEVIRTIESSDIYVEGSLQQNGVFLVWQTTLGMPCAYDPWMEAMTDGMEFGRNSGTGEEPMSVMAEKNAEAAVKAPSAGLQAETHYPAAKELALISPYWENNDNNKDGSFGDPGGSDETREQWEALCASIGSSTDHYYAMGNATIDNIAKAMEECAYVLVDSHGNTDYNNGYGDRTSRANCSYICLTTSAGLTSADTAGEFGPFGSYYYALYTKSGAMVSGTCITNHMDKAAPGSYVDLGICLGMATDGLFRPLRNAGVEAVLGYSQTVNFGYCGDYLRSVMSSLGEGSTLSAAIQIAKDTYGNWSGDSKTISEAQKNRAAFPIVVSSEDPYPGHGNVDDLQDVKSTWCLYEPGTRSFLVASDITQVGLTRPALIPGLDVAVWAEINGEFVTLPSDRLGVVWEGSFDNTDWSDPITAEAGTVQAASFAKNTVGLWIRARITPKNQEGHTFTLYSPMLQIREKIENYGTPTPPQVWTGREGIVYLSPASGQEYLVTTSETAPSEAEWVYAFTIDTGVDTDIRSKLTFGKMNYVYTRYFETDSMTAGTSVVSTPFWYGRSDGSLEGTKLNLTLAATPYTSHSEGFYETDIVKVDVSPIPDNDRFVGFPGSTWMVVGEAIGDAGVFYEDLACTTKLKSDTDYKTVYLKLMKPMNDVAISCGTTSTKGCYTFFDVADIQGRYQVSKVTVPEYSIQIGTLVTGLPFSYGPDKADYYVEQLYTRRNTNAQENGPEGTEPIVTFHADGTMTVDTNPCEQGGYNLLIYDVNSTNPVGRMRIWVGDFDRAPVTKIEFLKGQRTCYKGGWVAVKLKTDPENGAGLLTWKLYHLKTEYTVTECTYASINGPEQTVGNVCTAYITVNEDAVSGNAIIVEAICGTKTARCRIEVLDPPRIISQPKDVVCREGENATFTVEATGDDLTYQWYYRGPEADIWTPCVGSGANTASYTVYTYSGVDGYKYRCWINGGMQISRDAELIMLKSLKQAEITAPGPMVGTNPVFQASIPESANYIIGTKVSWYDWTTDKHLTPTEKFIEGHVYNLRVILYGKRGYYFSDDVSVTINGKECTCHSYPDGIEGSGGLAAAVVDYAFPPLEAEAVRIYGSSRYKTAMQSADYIKMRNSGAKFDTVIVAYGENHADALSGSRFFW